MFENEAHDLFGVDIEGIAIDFGGNFYALAQKEPMTIISPEQKAAREKARKVRAEAESRQGARCRRPRRPRTCASHPRGEVQADRRRRSSLRAADDLDARLAGCRIPRRSPSVKAAIAAKAAKRGCGEAGEPPMRRSPNLDPEKAAKVRKAALEAKAAREAAKTETEKEGE